MRWTRILALSLLAAGIPVSVCAAPIVDRGLPDANLNNAAGANRSNVAWGFGADFVSGDDFALPALPASKAWRIDRITTWAVAGAPDGSFALGDRYSTIALFLGADQGGGSVISRVASANLTGNSSDNPNVAVTPVQYPNNPGVDYQGSSGAFIQMWQIDFFDLGVFSTSDFLFAPHGVGSPDDPPIWFNHASNAALSGTTQDGSDDSYRWFSGNATDASLTFGDFLDSDGTGWDKSSDINVQVWASQVPEPASLALVALGFVALLLTGNCRRFMPISIR